MLQAMHGRSPSRFQLAATYAAGLAAAILTLHALGSDWKSWLLALIAFDWVAGVVATAAPPVRRGWAERPRGRLLFTPVHLIEAILVYWLSGGGTVFAVFALALFVKLAVFHLGHERTDARKAA